MVSSESVYTNNIIQADQYLSVYVLRNVCVCTHIAHILYITANLKEAMNLKGSKRDVWDGLEGGNGKEK